MTDHGWPTEPEDYLFGPWMNHTSTPLERKQYRQCVHPDCTAFEIREAPRS